MDAAATLAVAPATRIYKKDCIFFKDRLRRKEKERERGAERDLGTMTDSEREHAAENNEKECDDCMSSQIAYINDHVITNGITFIVGISDTNDAREHATGRVTTTSPDTIQLIMETECNLLEQYAQTFLQATTASGATEVTPKFALRASLSNGYVAVPRSATNRSRESALLHITGVWETENEFGVEYRWALVELDSRDNVGACSNPFYPSVV